MNIRFNSFIYIEVHHAGPNGEVVLVAFCGQ
jgi:hypothetical protein